MPIKKSVTKELKRADRDRRFWVHNGPILCDLVELRDVLVEISDDIYFFHVSERGNDFAGWVAEVLLDTSCSKDLLKAKDKVGAHSVVVKHLKKYGM